MEIVITIEAVDETGIGKVVITRSVTAVGPVTPQDRAELGEIHDLAYDSALAYVKLRDTGTVGA
jgi:hypothetical protein